MNASQPVAKPPIAVSGGKKQLFADMESYSNHKFYVAGLTALSVKAPDLWVVAGGLKTVWTTQIDRAATCGNFIYLNGEWMKAGWDAGELVALMIAFVIGHEVGHVVLAHMIRSKKYSLRGYVMYHGNRKIHLDFHLMNACADKIINSYLIARGLVPCANVIIDETVTELDLLEEVYLRDYLIKYPNPEDQPEPEKGQGDPEKGDGEPEEGGQGDPSDDPSDDTDTNGEPVGGGDPSGDPAPSEQPQPKSDDPCPDCGRGMLSESVCPTCGKGDDTTDDESGEGESYPQPTDHDGQDDHFLPEYEGTPEEQEQAEEQAQQEIEDLIEEAEEQARNQGFGSDSGEAGSLGKASMRPSEIDWREKLSDVLNAKSGRGGDDNWGRINMRRYVTSGVISPTQFGSLDRIIWSEDISWSVSQASRVRCRQEGAALIDQLNPTSGTLYLGVNSRVVEAIEISDAYELIDAGVKSGGGTYMSSQVDWLEENGEEPADVHLCFTDADMSVSDMERCAEAGIVLLIDTRGSYLYNKDELEQSGVEFIVCDDL